MEVVLIPKGCPQNVLAWPAGMPESNDRFVKDYGRFVYKLVSRYNKVKRNVEDLYQHVWLKLIESDLLTKFAERYMAEVTRIPSELDGETAAAFLGVTWDQWLAVMRSRLPWLPKPEKGKRTAKDATWGLEAVVLLDESGAFQVRSELSVMPGVDPERVKKAFQGYLSRAIHNHYANWCRSRSRKESSERLLPSGIRVEAAHTGGYYHHVEHDGAQSVNWEVDLPGSSPIAFSNPKKDNGRELDISIEDAVCIRNEFELAGVPLDTSKGQDVLAVLLEKGGDMNYTIREAILEQKAQQKAQSRRQARALLEKGGDVNYTIREAVLQKAQSRRRVRVRQG